MRFGLYRTHGAFQAAVILYLIGIRVVSGQAIGLRSDPNPAILAGQQRAYPTQVAVTWRRALTLLGTELVPIKAHQTVTCRDPEKALTVLHKGGDDTAGNDSGADRLESGLHTGIAIPT
jgi:hypothetical protein